MEKIINLPEGTVCKAISGSFYCKNCTFPLGASGLTIIGDDNTCFVNDSLVIGRNKVTGDNNRLRDAHYASITGNYNDVRGLKVTVVSGLKNKVHGSVEKDYGTDTIIEDFIPPSDISGCDYVTQVACNQFELPVETAEAMQDSQILSYIAMKTGLPLDFFNHLQVAPSKKRKRDDTLTSTRKPLPFIPVHMDNVKDENEACVICTGFGRSCVVVHEDTDGDSTGCFVLCASCATESEYRTCPYCRKPSKRVVRIMNIDISAQK